MGIIIEFFLMEKNTACCGKAEGGDPMRFNRPRFSRTGGFFHLSESRSTPRRQIHDNEQPSRPEHLIFVQYISIDSPVQGLASGHSM
jgi:hypothetical protein